MRARDDMTFPVEEYTRRLEELRSRMRERGLEGVVISDPENLMYLTDFQTTGYSFFQALIIPQDGEPEFITREMEESNVHARTWVEKTRPYSDTGDAVQMVMSALRDLGLDEGRVGYERNSYFFPAYQQDRMRSAMLKGDLVDCFGIVEEGRVTKSSAEIALMHRVAESTEAGMKAGYEAITAGVTENQIAGAVCHAMFAAGSEYPSVLPYVTSGPRSMIGHATWEGRVVQPGEHVFLEVAGCIRRYHTAMMRTVVLDELSPSMEKAQNRMMDALRAVHSFVRPGVTVSDVDMLVRDIINDNDVGAYLCTRAGYSIGIAFAPSWDEGYIISLKQGDPTILREGMTFHIIPWMWGVDGDKTVGISDTVYVTENGCASFFNLEMPFEVRPSGRKRKVPQAEHPVEAVKRALDEVGGPHVALAPPAAGEPQDDEDKPTRRKHKTAKSNAKKKSGGKARKSKAVSGK